jgi:hypothetical protein
MTNPGSPAARELARHLLERETAGAMDPERLGAALQRVCSRVAHNLRRSVGDDGYSAVLARAFVSAQAEEPLLKDMRRTEAGGIDLDVIEGVEGHGAEAVSTALEALLAAIVDILSELIGADMVRRLLDQDDGPQAPGAGRTQ